MSGAAHVVPPPAGGDGAFDLDAYLRRIGYSGPREPARATLDAVCAAQPARIAFENLDPFTGRAPGLSAARLQAKLVGARRGGYCYELNALLREALVALGFAVTGLAARVVWMQAPGAAPRARSHMLLAVDLPGEGRLVADAGFGGHLLGAPLELRPGCVAETPSGRSRIVLDGGGYAVEAQTAQGWQPLYRFTLDAQLPVDYEPANWFQATHPRSLFVNNLLVERLAPGERATLVNDRLAVTPNGEAPRARRIEDAADLARVLDETFDLEPPAGADELFARIPRGLDRPYVPEQR